jgi:hypothetical protein
MKKNTDNEKKNTERKSRQPKLEKGELTLEELESVSGGTGKNIYGLKAAKKRVVK